MLPPTAAQPEQHQHECSDETLRSQAHMLSFPSVEERQSTCRVLRDGKSPSKYLS